MSFNKMMLRELVWYVREFDVEWSEIDTIVKSTLEAIENARTLQGM